MINIEMTCLYEKHIESVEISGKREALEKRVSAFKLADQLLFMLDQSTRSLTVVETDESPLVAALCTHLIWLRYVSESEGS